MSPTQNRRRADLVRSATDESAAVVLAPLQHDPRQHRRTHFFDAARAAVHRLDLAQPGAGPNGYRHLDAHRRRRHGDGTHSAARLGAQPVKLAYDALSAWIESHVGQRCDAIDSGRSDTVQAKRIDATKLITHRFKLADILDAYETFAKAAETQALKVIIEA